MSSSSSSLLRRRSTTMDHSTAAVPRLPDDQQRRTLGLPTSLLCSPPSTASVEVLLNNNATTSSSSSSSGYNVTVEFEYELVVSNPNEPVVEVTSQDVPFLEYAVLQLMAQAIHLRPCDLPSQTLALTSNATVTGLSSFEPDSVDDSVPSCEFLTAVDTSWICLPMKGGMTATYFGTREDRDAVVGFLLTNLQNVVNNAGKTIGRVGDAYFVESRVKPASAPKTVASSNDNSLVALASSLAGAAVMTILLFYFVAARRRRNANKNPPTPSLTIGTKEAVFVDRDPVLHLAPTAVTTSTANTTAKSEELLQLHDNLDLEAPSSGDTAQVTIDSPSSTDAVAAAPISLMTGRTASTANMDDSDSDNENTPADQYEEELKRISNVPPNDDEFKNVGTSGTGEVGPTVMVDISKPPKPPTVHSNKPPVPVPVSKPLKKRRRRKKKRKSTSSQRSRDVVTGMETIAEGIEEETKSGNEDDDSEYSWYSTSDSEPGSRDPSPARSREESPCRSQSSSHHEESSPPRASVAEKNEGTEKPQHPPRWV